VVFRCSTLFKPTTNLEKWREKKEKKGRRIEGRGGWTGLKSRGYVTVVAARSGP